MRGRKPAEIKYNPNPIVGWQQWDLEGCLKLVCAVAEDYGVRAGKPTVSTVRMIVRLLVLCR